MGKDEPDISELVEKAKIVAEATGRDEQEVLADLLDDGIVNLSNEESKGKDLVTQLFNLLTKRFLKTRFSMVEKTPQKSRSKPRLKATLWIGLSNPCKGNPKISRN